MIRNVVGSVLALVGATAAVWSPFRAWYDGRHGRDYPIEDLFAGITDTRPEVSGSLLLPFAAAALVTIVGVVLRSRLLVALAGLIVLGFTILWMVRVGQAEDGLSVGGDRAGLDHGVAIALAGGVLLLLGALLMAGRKRDHGPASESRIGRRRRRREHDTGEPNQNPAAPYPDTYRDPDPNPYPETHRNPETDPNPYPETYRDPDPDPETYSAPTRTFGVPDRNPDRAPDGSPGEASDRQDRPRDHRPEDWPPDGPPGRP